VKCAIEKRGDKTHVSLIDQGRTLFTGSGDNPKEAAHWVLKHLRRVTNETVRLFADAGTLDKDEMEAVLEMSLDDVLGGK